MTGLEVIFGFPEDDVGQGVAILHPLRAHLFGRLKELKKIIDFFVPTPELTVHYWITKPQGPRTLGMGTILAM